MELIDTLTTRPDLLVVDSPRDGIHPKAIDKLAALNAPRILYISCNPVTQKRDIEILEASEYEVEHLEAVDQFPRTAQWEAGKVLGLSRPYTFFKVILPVVIQRSFPAYSNEVITLVKDTSLVYILGVMDILKAAKSVSNTMSSILPYVYVGIVYLIIVGILTVILNKMERKIQAS